MAHGNSVTPSRAHSKLKCWTAEPEPATFLETETMDPTAHVGVDHPASAAAAASVVLRSGAKEVVRARARRRR